MTAMTADINLLQLLNNFLETPVTLVPKQFTHCNLVSSNQQTIALDAKTPQKCNHMLVKQWVNNILVELDISKVTRAVLRSLTTSNTRNVVVRVATHAIIIY
jgi:hypothetical protein